MLINRNFTLLWVGGAISTLGDFIFDTTLILWIATVIARGQPWAPLAVSGVLLATALPTFIVGPLAGVFVDRWDKRRTMLAMDALRALLIILLLGATGIVPLPLVGGLRLAAGWQLAAIYATVALSTVCAQFFSPSRMVIIGDVVDEPRRARASGMTQVTTSLATILGPPLAAPLLFGVGVQWALIVNALSFGASFLSILAIRVPRLAAGATDASQGQFLREFAEGLRFFGRNRVLVTILISVVLVMLGGGALNALDYFFVTRNLHAAPGLYGLLATAQGLGSLGGAILAGLFAQRLGVARTFWASILGIGLIVLVYARLTAFGPALVVICLGGVPGAAVNVAAGPLILHVTPREYVGRVMAVIQPLISLATMVSIAIAGYLVSTVLRGFHAVLLGFTLGPVDTIFTAMGVLMLAGGLYAMAGLRGVRLATSSEPAPAPAEALA